MTKLDDLIAAIRALPEHERQQVLEALQQQSSSLPQSPIVGSFSDDPDLLERAMKAGRTNFDAAFSTKR
ncbi:MAG: hypothetical protein ABTQ32_03340 [Myxococcaceae bacterium]